MNIKITVTLNAPTVETEEAALALVEELSVTNAAYPYPVWADHYGKAGEITAIEFVSAEASVAERVVEEVTAQS